MTLGRVDARFLLPAAPTSATLRPGAGAWREPLERLGIALEGGGDGGDVVVVASAADGAEPMPGGSAMVVVEGRRPRAPTGLAARRYLPLPSAEHPALLVPLDRPRVATYVLRTWLFPRTRRRALATWALAQAPQALRLVPRPQILVATRRPDAPFLVAAAARAAGLPSPLDWFLVCGQGDELARGTFVLFRRRAAVPEWVVKFARVPGYDEPFARDERGLELAATAGGAAAAYAPRLLARFEEQGHHASVETAGVGPRLQGLLGMGRSRDEKLRLVEGVARWTTTVARETAGRAGGLAAEVERLRREVLPRYPAGTADLVRGLEGLPGVLAHNDLGTWNVVATSPTSFTVLDWESARAGASPLWDLWYFLADALCHVDGARDDPVDHFRQLFAGAAPSSPVLFRLTREAVSSLGVPAEAVGRLATLCWLHHGTSHLDRAESLGRHAGTTSERRWAPQDYPGAWLTDSRLGPDWGRWQE